MNDGGSKRHNWKSWLFRRVSVTEYILLLVVIIALALTFRREISNYLSPAGPDPAIYDNINGVGGVLGE